MKIMCTKKIICYYLLFVFVLSFSFSCHKPKAFQKESVNQTTGSENNKEKELLESYEGVESPPNVSVDALVYENVVRERITGLEGQIYKGIDACQSGDYDFSVTIVASQAGDNYFTIRNFGGFDFEPADVRCEIIGIDEKGNIQFVIPIHKDVGNEGTRLINSNQTVNGFDSIGSIDRETGILTIRWQVIFFDQETDECQLILSPLKMVDKSKMQ